jgi:uncharacterized membrane protein YoaK (UPF0700 family)
VRVISKFPRWIRLGGGLLAFNAGMVNAVALLGLEHQAVSHVTGTVSQAGVRLAAGEAGAALPLLGIAACFFAGALLSGLIVRDSALTFGRMYGAALILEGALLAAAVPLLLRHSLLGDGFAAAACGVLNAMASTYSGTILRTTLLTGIVSDLGIAGGRRLGGMGPDGRRVRLLGTILAGFLAGSAAGAWAFGRLGYAALLVPAGLCGGLGVAYALLRRLRPAGP